MMNGFNSSRERMMAALNCRTLDYAPCSFMLYKGLQTTSQNYADFIERQIAMGLDAYVMLPPRPTEVINDHYNLHGIPVSYSPEVKIVENIEKIEGESFPIMTKEYHTPAGFFGRKYAKLMTGGGETTFPFLTITFHPGHENTWLQPPRIWRV